MTVSQIMEKMIRSSHGKIHDTGIDFYMKKTVALNAQSFFQPIPVKNLDHWRMIRYDAFRFQHL